jgi:hypothetical protein
MWYHSCWHRLCRPCPWLQLERWLARQKRRLWAGAPSPVSFTLPHERNDLGLVHVTVMPQRLCASVPETRVAWLGEATSLGAQPGVLAT